jgi:Flp pilus assembly pilin Flp
MFMIDSVLLWLHAKASLVSRRMIRSERGQATAEYALVLLGAAAVAVLLLGWAAKSGKIGELLDKVFDTVTNKIN